MTFRSMISASCDIMSVDVGTDSKMMNVIKNTYSTVINTNSVETDAVVTGKGMRFGGLQAYPDSFGLGIANSLNFIEQNCGEFKTLKATKLATGGSKKSVIIKGFGKNGVAVAKALLEINPHFKIVGITHGDHGMYNQIGLDPVEISEYLESHEDILEGFTPNIMDANKILTKNCDLLISTESCF